MSGLHNLANHNRCAPQDTGNYLGAIGDCHLHAFDAIEPVSGFWQTLQANAPHSPFQQLNWVRSVIAGATKQSGPSGRKSGDHIFIVGFVAEKPVLIVPLEVKKGLLGPRLTWLGEKISDYNGPVIDREFQAGLPQGFFGGILDLLHEAKPEIHASHLIRNPVGGLKFAQGNTGRSRVLPAEFMSHAMTLRRNWKEYYAQIRSAKSRQRLRSKNCALKRSANLSFRRIREPYARKDATGKILAWKTEQLDNMGARNRFGHHDDPELLWLAIEEAVRHDDRSLEVFGLFKDDRLIAGMLAFVTGETFYNFVSSYSPEVSRKYSVGTLLTVKTMELAARANFKTYDFLIGDEAYKSDWCDTHLTLQHFTHAFTWRGRLICAAIALRLSVKKFIIRHGEFLKAVQAAQKQITLLKSLSFQSRSPSVSPVNLDKMKAKGLG